MLPRLIFAENHTDPITFQVLAKLTQKLAAISYQSFYDEMPRNSTLDDYLSEVRIYLSRVKLILKALGKDINDYDKLDLSDPSLLLTDRSRNDFLARYPKYLSREQFLVELRKSNMDYVAIDDENTGDSTKCPSLQERDNLMAAAYLKSKEPFFARIGLAHVDGIQSRLFLNAANLQEAKNFRFYFIHSLTENKPLPLEQTYRANEAILLTGITVIDANNKSVDEIAASIMTDIFNKMKKGPSPTSEDENAELNALLLKQKEQNIQQGKKLIIQMNIIAALKKSLNSQDELSAASATSKTSYKFEVDEKRKLDNSNTSIEAKNSLKKYIVDVHELLLLQQKVIQANDTTIASLKEKLNFKGRIFATNATAQDNNRVANVSTQSSKLDTKAR